MYSIITLFAQVDCLFEVPKDKCTQSKYSILVIDLRKFKFFIHLHFSSRKSNFHQSIITYLVVSILNDLKMPKIKIINNYFKQTVLFMSNNSTNVIVCIVNNL